MKRVKKKVVSRTQKRPSIPSGSFSSTRRDCAPVIISSLLNRELLKRTKEVVE